jgi:coenzyme F420-reducing hydrogenase beta subunit
VVSLLKTHGVNDHTRVRRLEFREGDWPGNLRIELDSGRVVAMPKFHANFLIPFFIMKRCLLCVDLANELADFSVGDAWAPEYEKRGKGYSIVIARSGLGMDILNHLISTGIVGWTPIGEDEAISMHTHGLDLKKRGAFIRMKYRKYAGLSTPNYGLQTGSFPFSRYVMEMAIVGLFWLFGTRMSRFLLRQINPNWMGRAFVGIRKSWKRMTRRIKAGVHS